MSHSYQVLVVLVLSVSCHGFFEWKNCVKPTVSQPKLLREHACEGGKDVVLTCRTGYKISIQKVFFGHGNGHKSTCDNSWFGQNCAGKEAETNVNLLCQDKVSCTISPISSVLGKSSCTFGLISDLIVEYKCYKDLVEDSMSVQSLQLSPSPIVLPGKVNASIGVLVKRRLPASTKLKLQVQSKILGAWVGIPCIANLGSCEYNNFCDMLRGVMFNKCDRDMAKKGIPCDCPIPTGLYTVQTQSITVTQDQVDKIPVWDSLVNGQYWIKAEYKDVYGRSLGCFSLQFELAINSDRKKRSLRIQVL